MSSPHRRSRRAAHSFAIPPLSPALLLALTATGEALARRVERRTPLGQRLVIRGDNTRRVHVLYHAPPELRHAPCVVMEAGANSWSPVWDDVSRRIGHMARVFRYDRAGFGFSDAVRCPKERSVAAVVADLRAALVSAGARPPYVLVAHSLGALYANVLVKLLQPSEVCGLVYVDGASPQTVSMLERVVPKHTPPYWLARSLGCSGVLRVLAPLVLPQYTAAFRGELRKHAVATWARGDWLMAYTAEWAAALRESKRVVNDGLLHFPPGWLGDTPICVLVPDIYRRTRGRSHIDALQATLATYSADARLVHVRNCGHFVHIERPEEVAAAVRAVIARARQKRLIGGYVA